MFEEANGLNKPQTETNAEAEPKAEVNARAKAIFARMKELNEAQQCVRPGRVKQTGADLEALTVEIGANHLDAVERHLNEHPCNRIAPVNHDGYSPDWALIDAFNRLESGIDGANGFYDGT